MSADTTTLDPCGCCEGLAEPAPPRNDAGLPALAYRADTQPGFNARMLQSLPLARRDALDAASTRPLARLLTRAPNDPTVAFVDAAACVADVLAFYSERIANEGFLRTATERRSVLELARAIGYELKPGVAASVHLAFKVEDAPGAPGLVWLAQGMPVQSIPPQGKLPQVFETGAGIVARAEWNALVPRQLRPADMAVLHLDPDAQHAAGRDVLALLGPQGSFVAGTAGLHEGLASASLHRLDPNLPIDPTVDAIEVGRVYLGETAGTLRGGDLLLFVALRADGEPKPLVLRTIAASPEPALKRIRVDVEPLPDPQAADPAPLAGFSLAYRIAPIFTFARAQVAPVPFTLSTIATAVVARAWRESDLQAMIGIQGWNPIALARLATSPPVRQLVPTGGAFAFGTRLGFFGHNAPKWKSLPANKDNVLNGNAYAQGWDDGDTPTTGTVPRSVWVDSQGSGRTNQAVLVERAVPDVARASWVVFDSPDAVAKPYLVLDARETSVADFGISGRAMRLRLADASGVPLTQAQAEPTFHFRSANASVASRQLALADLPITEDIEAGDTQVELDRVVLGLAAGQPVALVGENADLPGENAAEIAVLADIVHADGRSTLLFQKGLVNAYRRAGLAISANVAPATHGESVIEVLGNGDASQPNQAFALKKPPTTFLSAVGGVANTLEVRVAGVRWDELPSLYGAAPDAPVYTTRVADDASMAITFGDGTQGARLPSGTLNVSARYRSGIGSDGEVAAGTLTMLRAMPLGLRGVTNPVPATGAQDPERLADARRNAPLTLLTFDRVVSLLDYANFASAFPGIGKARGDVLWVAGASRIFLTVAGATGGPPGATVLANLIASIASASDPSQRFDVGDYAQRYFSLKAKVAVDPRYVTIDVLAAVRAAVLAAFGFDARDLGQSVTAAEVLALMHTVAGVVAVDLDELAPYTDAPAAAPNAPPTAVPAFGARLDAASRTTLPAELLLVNPAAVDLAEMAP